MIYRDAVERYESQACQNDARVIKTLIVAKIDLQSVEFVCSKAH